MWSCCREDLEAAAISCPSPNFLPRPLPLQGHSHFPVEEAGPCQRGLSHWRSDAELGMPAWPEKTMGDDDLHSYIEYPNNHNPTAWMISEHIALTRVEDRAPGEVCVL